MAFSSVASGNKPGCKLTLGRSRLPAQGSSGVFAGVNRQERRGQQFATVSRSAAVDSVSAENVMPVSPNFALETDRLGRERIALSEVGWSTWEWEGKKINYIQAGETGTAVVLIHGFGASAYHWRYNIPELAKRHRVYALCLLGFGFSEKPLANYAGARLWSSQVAAFIREKVGSEKAILAGNSLGGFVSIATAAEYPELVKGVIGLNVAGYFEDTEKGDGNEAEPSNAFAAWWKETVKAVQESLKKAVITFTFYRTRSRIKPVLEQVYPCKDSVDDDLVRSIALPAEDDNAAEVFYRLINSTVQPRSSLDSLLGKMEAPLLLLWGDQDPWMGPKKAAKIMDLYPKAEKIGLDAGHCPHDEVPGQVNEAILKWAGDLKN